VPVLIRNDSGDALTRLLRELCSDFVVFASVDEEPMRRLQTVNPLDVSWNLAAKRATHLLFVHES
jgi:hypothetical protein